MDELEAIELLKKGDLNGLEPLVEKYYIRAVHSAYLIVQDEALAEDIVQTTFLTSSRKIYQLTSNRFGPWFYRSVINAAIRAAKRQSRSIRFETQEDESSADVKEWLLDRQPLPEALTENAELRRQIKNALLLLTPNQRGAIVARYYLEMSEIEIGHFLNAPVSSIKWWLHVAKQNLRQFLSGQVDQTGLLDTETARESKNEKDG